MYQIEFGRLRSFVEEMCKKQGLSEADSKIMGDIYISTTKRGVGHHDIYNFPSRIEQLKEGKMNANYKMKKVSGFGGMEAWDGDNGPGEVINYYAMEQAMELASEHGIGMVAMRNSNHYLCSAPFIEYAARSGYIAFIIAKGIPTMGMPGFKEKLVGQSPVGFSFPVGNRDPFMMDMCLAYISGEGLAKKAENSEPVPEYWGADTDGNPTTDANSLLSGVKYPVGYHKGFGMAIMCELLTGVMSGGLILDEGAEQNIGYKSSSHTLIAIKADGLMSRAVYDERSGELVNRLKHRAENVQIPGERSFAAMKVMEAAGFIELEDDLVEKLLNYGKEYKITMIV